MVETKAKEIRMSEVRAIKAQENLFKNIPNVKWKLLTNPKEVNDILRNL